MPRYSAADVSEAHARLRELVNPGDTVFTVLRHVSKSGMTRDIDLYVIKDGEPMWLSALAAKVLGMSRKGDAIRIGGCGMDMGFRLVYNLSSVLFRDQEKDKHGESQSCREGGQENLCANIRCRSHGYWLKHRWM
jgi:hypothetical protein